jgi:pSer/pThr/pTyr-binding forkhead associated (FHA) protein
VKVSLVVLSPGKSQGKTIPVVQLPFLIGRDPACHLRPGSGLVSGRHCALLVREGQLFVRDLKSTNGTLLDDKPLRGESVLKGGERIQVGPLLFGVNIDRRISVTDPTPMPGIPAPPEAATDDEAASILLFLAKDEKPSSGGIEFSAEDVAEVTTVDGSSVASAGAETQKLTSPENPKDGPPTSSPTKGDTATVADALLKQYLRRNRK